MVFGLFGGAKKRAAELYEAAQKGDLDGVRQALDKGADINALDPECSETALHAAVDKSQKAVVDLLLSKGANPDIVSGQHYTPLIIAAAQGDVALPMVESLLAGKANPELAPTTGPNAGGAPMHIAASNGSNAILAKLLAAGAKPKVLPNGSTLMHIAAIGGNAETVELVSKTGISVDCIDSQSRTPLHLTGITGNPAVARKLLELGASVDKRDGEDCTPLMHAALQDKANVVDLLLKNGANPDIVVDNGGSVLSPLYGAAIRGYDAVVKLLLKAGVPADKKIGDFPIAAEMAKQAGHESTAKLLKVTKKKQPKSDTKKVSKEKKVKATTKQDSANHGDTGTLIKEKAQELTLKMRIFAELSGVGDDEQREELFQNLLIEAGVEVATEIGDTSEETIRNVCVQILEAMNSDLDGDEESGDDEDEELPPLFKSIKEEDLKSIKELVKSEGKEVLEAEIQSITPLMFAISNDNEKITRELIKLGADVNHAPEEKLSPLLLACNSGDEKLSRLLIENGANVNFSGWTPFETEDGEIRIENITPLFLASQAGATDLVKLLISKGADPNIVSGHGFTPLIAAIKHHKNDTAMVLMESGARIDDDPPKKLKVESWACLNPLLACVTNGNIEMLHVLIDKGVRKDLVNERGNNAVKLAAMHGSEEMVQLLLENGCAPDLPDRDGWTALHNAAGQGYVEIVKMLLAAGADPNMATTNEDIEERGRSSLIDAANDGYDEIVQILLDHGADPSHQSAVGSSAIREAIFTDHLSTAKLLLEAGADIHQVDQFGHSALSFALLKLAMAHATQDESEQEWKQFVDRLLDLGADPTVRPTDNPNIYLMQSAMVAGDDVATKLIHKGALEGLSDDEMVDLLVNAATANCENTFQTLFEKSFRTLKVQDDLSRLLLAAASSGNESAVTLLLQQATIHELTKDVYINAYQNAIKKGHRKVGLKLLAVVNEKSDEIDRQDDDGYTAIMHATVNCDIDKLTSLLEADADPNRLDLFAETPLSFALEKKLRDHDEYEGIVEALISHGAQVDEDLLDGVDAILSAASRGALGSIMVALTNIIGNDEELNLSTEDLLNSTDENDNTPLILAAENGHAGLVRVLPLLGADVNARNNDLNSAYEVARSAGYHNICETLAEYSADDAANENGMIEWRLIPASESRRSGPGKDD
jgi:ankyrin repeat protein